MHSSEVSKLTKYLIDIGYEVVDLTKTMNLDTHKAHYVNKTYIEKPNTVFYFLCAPETEEVFKLIRRCDNKEPNRHDIMFLFKNKSLSSTFTAICSSVKITFTRFLTDNEIQCNICLEEIKAVALPCVTCNFVICRSCQSKLTHPTICSQCKHDNKIKQL